MVWIGELIFDDGVLQLLGGASGPGGKEDGVGFVGLERAVSAIADAAVAKDFAALQFNVAEVGELLLLRARGGKQNDEANCVNDEAPICRNKKSWQVRYVIGVDRTAANVFHSLCHF